MSEGTIFTRKQLAEFLPSHEAIKAFEKIVEDVSVNIPAANFEVLLHSLLVNAKIHSDSHKKKMSEFISLSDMQLKHGKIIEDIKDELAILSSSCNSKQPLLKRPFTINTRIFTTSGDVNLLNEDELVIVKKSVGAATNVNLPATPKVGQNVVIKDGKGDAVTNNITIIGTIDGVANLIMNTNYECRKVVFNGTDWNAIT